MKCTRATNLISDYVDDLLPASARAELELHLSQCKRCSLEVDRLRRMLGGLRSLSRTDSGVDCWDVIRSRIVDLEQPRHRPRWTWLLRPTTLGPAFAAAALAAALVIGPTKPRPDAYEARKAVEYRSYIFVHSRAQQRQALNDPDVAILAGQLEQANLSETLKSRR